MYLFLFLTLYMFRVILRNVIHVVRVEIIYVEGSQ